MIFWLATLFLLTIAALSALLPLARSNDLEDASNQTLDVYRKQLLELDQEIAATDDVNEQLQQRRTEVARRVLRAARLSGSSRRSSDVGAGARRHVVVASLFALLVIPVATLVLYGAYGASGQPDFPLSARQDLPLQDRPIEDLVAIAEKHLVQNPNDAKGWRLLANVYGKLNQPTKRAQALRQIVRLSGETPELLTDLGEALTVAGGNIVPAEARKLFERALADDAGNTKASIYLALALDQEGKARESLAIWEQIDEANRDDARLRDMASAQITRLRSKLNIVQIPNSQPDVAERPTMDMVNNMVESLANRLAEEPGTIIEWSRLIRSYMVLNKRADAVDAMRRARKQFANEPEELKILAELERELEVPDGSKPQG